MTLFVVYFVSLLAVCFSLNYNCPPEEELDSRCICKDLGNGPMMLCTGLYSADDLVSSIHVTEKYEMFSLAIHESSLMYIPNRIFKNTNYKKIRFVETQLMSLAEDDLAFEGLEETLEEFRVMGAHYVTQWSWSHFRNLKRMDLIDVDLVSLGSISESFPPLKSLKALGISKADISYIVDDAFSELENLRILSLNKNDISELKRSMLPNPANHLIILNLSDNKLSSLPDNFFDGMPSLSDVNLANNEFTTLSDAFLPALDTVGTLSLKGNNIRCDCRLRWIIDVRTPLDFHAVCAAPKNLKGKKLRYLEAKDLSC